MTDDRTDWLAWRRTGIGGSDIAAIAGVEGAFGTPYSVWLSKVTDDEGDETEPMLWGSLLENVILDEVERRTGLTLAWRQLRATHPDHPHHLATLDAVGYDLANHPGGLVEFADGTNIECKNTGDRSWVEPPTRYWAQAQWQMHVTGTRHTLLVVLHAGTRLEVYDIPRDDDDIAVLVQAADEFWNTYVIPKVPPRPSWRDGDAVRRYVGPSDDSIVYASPELESLVAQLHAARDSAKAADQYAQALEAQLVAQIAGAAAVLDQRGQPLATFKHSRSFDTATAVSEHPDLVAACQRLDLDAFKKALGRKAVEDYMRPADSRRLLLPTRKDH